VPDFDWDVQNVDDDKLSGEPKGVLAIRLRSRRK